MAALEKFKFSPGERIGVSGWKRISQERIDRFAEATDDFQFVHLDSLRAARETPFGGTIAHGFLTLSLVSSLAEEVFPSSSEVKAVMLFAVDHVKFINPVRSGSRLRGEFILDRLVWVSNKQAVAKVHVVLEIENQAEPAVTCDVSWLFMFDGESSALAAGGSDNPPQLDVM